MRLCTKCLFAVSFCWSLDIIYLSETLSDHQSHWSNPCWAWWFHNSFCFVNESGAMPSPPAIFIDTFLGVLAVYLFNVHNFALLVQLLLLKSIDNADIEWSKEVKGSIYDVIVEGFQLLSRWTARIWEQCAWKFSRPCKDPVPLESHETSASFSDYEKVLCPLSAFILFFLLICNRSSLSSFHIFLFLSLKSCNKTVSLQVQWIFWLSELSVIPFVSLSFLCILGIAAYLVITMLTFVLVIMLHLGPT